MLTERRKEILEFIEEFKKKYGTIPTIREICNHFGLKSTNGVYEHLKALEKEGYLEIKPYKARNISLKKESKGGLPLLGEVAAGEPIYPTLTEGEHVELPLNQGSSFLLKVRGDSMIKAGIESGDLVVVDREKPVNNRDIVVALIDGEVTLKRLIIKKDGIELKPENDNYNVIKVGNQHFEIIGKVTLLIRKLA